MSYRNIKGSKSYILDNMDGEFGQNIVKLIRQDIKQAKSSGIIAKGFRISVKQNRGGMSYSVSININAVPEDATAEDVKFVYDKLNEIQESYNSDNSDVGRDYFEVGFYCSINHEYKYK